MYSRGSWIKILLEGRERDIAQDLWTRTRLFYCFSEGFPDGPTAQLQMRYLASRQWHGLCIGFINVICLANSSRKEIIDIRGFPKSS